MLRRSLSYFRGCRWHLAGGVALLLLAAVLELALPWPVKWLVDSVFGSEEAPGLIAWLPGFGEGGSQLRAAGSIALLVVVLGLAHKGFVMSSQLLFIDAGNRMVRSLRLATLGHLYRLSLAFHDRSRVGDLIYRACYDSYGLQALLSRVFVPLLSGLCVAVGVVAVMLRVDVILTLVTVATAPFFWMNLSRFRLRIQERSRRFRESESAIASQVQEALTSIRAIQAFTLEPVSGARLERQADASVRENMRKSVSELGFSFVVGVIMSLGTAAVIWLGARGVIEGRLTIGDVLVFLAYLGTLYRPISAFSEGASAYHSASAQLRRVFELLDEPGAIPDAPDAIEPGEVRGALSFEGVSFAYDPRRPVLRGLDLDLGSGRVFALVGETGSGKSTIANLILRFHDPDEGRVLLDGRDLRTLKLAWLRRQIGMVFQEPILFSGTIAENIGFGRERAGRGEIEEAARRARAHGFITALPDGYDTVLGERGVNLSAGQRQRISIARAFLKDAPVLILDEPTSALDPRTEDELLRAFEALMENRTVLIIANRLSTVRNADRIGVLEGGRIVEFGTHEELMQAKGAYWKLQEARTAARGGDSP